ncbi:MULTISPECIES: c-type cytochrome [unclassified Yoonia]|uniref:c-type cytochrome n=1 Tax=unclassified Yoonia TaxID=2629118 RepID=UPI002AFE45D5|nr:MULTISPECIES: c-type cytochrome [unclassified Yoonia]
MARWPWIAGLAVLAIGAGWVATRPAPLPATALDGITPDAARGETVFAIAGCANCHAATDGPREVLSGGRAFASDFGTFHAPNISSDPVHGVGGWTDLELASAITRGVSPQGAHYYPAFPYTSYIKADLQDVADLIAHMRSLPASNSPSLPHDLRFPYNIRAGLGAWKALYLRDDWVADAPTPELERGRVLVEALGHCAECHTPRDALGGLDRSAWMTGAPNPSGEGRIPGITPTALDWSAQDIAAYLQSGFTPEFDSAGGSMAEVIHGTAALSDDDRLAIAAYLKALP